MQGEKSIPIVGLDDKEEVTVVLAVPMAGEYLPPLINYQGKTEMPPSNKVSTSVRCVAL